MKVCEILRLPTFGREVQWDVQKLLMKRLGRIVGHQTLSLTTLEESLEAFKVYRCCVPVTGQLPEWQNSVHLGDIRIQCASRFSALCVPPWHFVAPPLVTAVTLGATLRAFPESTENKPWQYPYCANSAGTEYNSSGDIDASESPGGKPHMDGLIAGSLHSGNTWRSRREGTSQTEITRAIHSGNTGAKLSPGHSRVAPSRCKSSLRPQTVDFGLRKGQCGEITEDPGLWAPLGS